MFDFEDLSAVTVRPREPFFEWARNVSDGVPVEPEDWDRDPNVFLLPKAEDLDGLMQEVRRVYRGIWEAELRLWEADERRWPAPRTLEFLKWFALVGHTGVIRLRAVRRLS